MFQFTQYTWSKQDSFHYKRYPWVIDMRSHHGFSYNATSFYSMPRFSALFTRHSSSLRAPDSNRLPSDLEASSHRTTRVRVGILKFDNRFARQNSYGPPSGFRLTSTYSSIVHHLSGPTIYALARHLAKKPWRRRTVLLLPACRDSHFHYAFGFSTQSLAQLVDSLVRVTRRDDLRRHLCINLLRPSSIYKPKPGTIAVSEEIYILTLQ